MKTWPRFVRSLLSPRPFFFPYDLLLFGKQRMRTRFGINHEWIYRSLHFEIMFLSLVILYTSQTYVDGSELGSTTKNVIWILRSFIMNTATSFREWSRQIAVSVTVAWKTTFRIFKSTWWENGFLAKFYVCLKWLSSQHIVEHTKFFSISVHSPLKSHRTKWHDCAYLLSLQRFEGQNYNIQFYEAICNIDTTPKTSAHWKRISVFLSYLAMTSSNVLTETVRLRLFSIQVWRIISFHLLRIRIQAVVFYRKTCSSCLFKVSNVTIPVLCDFNNSQFIDSILPNYYPILTFKN